MDEFEALLAKHLAIIEMLGDDLTMASREKMAQQLAAVRFQQDIEFEEEQLMDEVDLL